VANQLRGVGGRPRRAKRSQEFGLRGRECEQGQSGEKANVRSGSLRSTSRAYCRPIERRIHAHPIRTITTGNDKSESAVHQFVNDASNLNDTEQRRAPRKRIRAQYRVLYNQLVEILLEHDPLGVHAGHGEKFVPEATTILAGLRDARVAEDVEQILLQELWRWYGRRHLTNQDQHRTADGTIAICVAWNHFLDVSAS